MPKYNQKRPLRIPQKQQQINNPVPSFCHNEEDFRPKRVYTEYRQDIGDLSKKLCQNYGLRDKLVDDLVNSEDLRDLISYNYVIKPIDELDNFIKIGLTIASKVAKHYF